MKRQAHSGPHKYYRVKNKQTYRCSVPGCPHMITGGKEMLVGRSAECPYCGTKFTITYELLRVVTIHCGKCTKNGKPILTELEEKATVTPVEADVFKTLLSEKGIS